MSEQVKMIGGVVIPGQSDISVMCLEIDESLASTLLESNTLNRPVSKAVVAKYAYEMKAGGWEIGIDPICISDGGYLMNGQHRLMAVVTSGVTVKAIVFMGVSEASFRVMDRGRVRSYAFALSMDRDLAAMARLLAVTVGVNGKALASDSSIKSAADFIDTSVLAMCEVGIPAKKGITAAFKLAAALRGMKDGGSYAFDQLRLMSLGDVEGMSPCVLSVWKRMMTRGGSLSMARGAQAQRDDLAAAWRFLDVKRAGLQKIPLDDSSAAISEILAFVGDALE